ncbi:MAG: hypothetical protein ACOZB3_08425 [Calditrichota bacterium]
MSSTDPSVEALSTTMISNSASPRSLRSERKQPAITDRELKVTMIMESCKGVSAED